VILLPQITYLLADSMRNYSSDLNVQMSAATPRPLLRFQVEIRGSFLSKKKKRGRMCSCQGHRDTQKVEALIGIVFVVIALISYNN
jgi:hypothetical protein